MIGRPITFDGEHVAARLIGMANSKIDLEPRRPNLFVDLVPRPSIKATRSPRNGESASSDVGCAPRELARLGILQKSLEDPRSFTLRAIEIDIAGCKGYKDLAATARPRKEHIEAALASFLRNGAKGHAVETCTWRHVGRSRPRRK